MPQDFEYFAWVNLEVSAAEDRGDVDTLDRHIAPTLAFRRANGDLDNKEAFLQKVEPSGPGEISIQSIALLRRNRALVTCVVCMLVMGARETSAAHRLLAKTRV
jgi:hypothetical protein